MSYRQKISTLALAGILAAGVTASGCATPWFGSSGKAKPNGSSQAATDAQGTDLKQATITYISNLCKLPKEQHDAMVRDLNEALLPNHAAISCGRGGGAL